MTCGVGLVAFACATAAGTPSSWIHVRPGRQCELTDARREAVQAEERARLDVAGVRALELHVAASLEALPETCRPSGGIGSLAAAAARRRQQDVTELLSLMACAACGCPQPWFVCVRTGAGEAELAPLDYLPVE